MFNAASNNRFNANNSMNNDDIVNMAEEAASAFNASMSGVKTVTFKDKAISAAKTTAVTVATCALVGAIGGLAWHFLQSSGVAVEDAVESLLG